MPDFVEKLRYQELGKKWERRGPVRGSHISQADENHDLDHVAIMRKDREKGEWIERAEPSSTTQGSPVPAAPKKAAGWKSSVKPCFLTHPLLTTRRCELMSIDAGWGSWGLLLNVGKAGRGGCPRSSKRPWERPRGKQ